MDVPQDKVWFMPAGDSREGLFKSYPLVFDWVRDNGYRRRGDHILLLLRTNEKYN